MIERQIYEEEGGENRDIHSEDDPQKNQAVGHRG